MVHKIISVNAQILVFRPMHKYFKISNTNQISECKSKGFSDEVIEPPTTSDNSLAPELSDYGNKTTVKFNESCLKQDKVTYNHRTVVNITEWW